MASETDYFDTLTSVFQRVEATLGDGSSLTLSQGIEQAIRMITSRTKAGRKVIFIGNGGSAAIASHQVVDYWKNGGMRAIAFNDSSLLTCIGNDYGYPHVFEKPVEMFADQGDVLIAISSSGQSENILRGGKAGLQRAATSSRCRGSSPTIRSARWGA